MIQRTVNVAVPGAKSGGDPARHFTSAALAAALTEAERQLIALTQEGETFMGLDAGLTEQDPPTLTAVGTFQTSLEQT